LGALIVLFVCFAKPVSSQDPAPVEQCRADLASWTHDFNLSGTVKEDSLLTYQQLKDRSTEASKCALMDDKEPYHGTAEILQIRYAGLMRDRLYDFLVRHNMLADFQKEDTNGLR
jgi:hypothetical protein